ncbi:MAG: methyltransferase domain-containing protein [Planctomycetota bacterium]
MALQTTRAHYDELLYSDIVAEYCGGGDFANFGYREADDVSARAASEGLVDQLVGMLSSREGTILDVACGKGATTRRLLQHYQPEQITAINISAKQLGTARDNAAGCGFAVMDAVELGFPSASFDNVICVEAAFHFKTRERFFGEVLRVLKPGGQLVLSDVLMAPGAESRRPTFQEENYLPNLTAYEERALAAGFTEAVTRDVTLESWQRHFWGMVRFGHQKLLARELDAEGLRSFLARTYDMARDLEVYLLASMRKGQ